ncbi:MAG: MtrB/PioB family outer membrane beta-barrel protein [Elusimicrobia bacterium]|nr:MtrB/PioB family outer membrane beta-barrel protein [Elusimicrobiota bacterium]
MNFYRMLNIAAAALLFAAPAFAEVRQGLDFKYQHRNQKTVNGEPSAIPTEYGEIPNGLILEKYKIDFEAEKYFIDAEVTNLGLNNQNARVEGGDPGKLMWKAGWDKMPHLFSNEARTLYKDEGNGRLTISDTLQSFNQPLTAAGYNDSIKIQLAAAQPVPLGFEVETSNMDMHYRLAPDLTLSFGGWRQTKQGTKPQPASFGFSNAVEVAAPIDWATNEAFFDMELAKKEYQLAFSYRMSDFRNNIPSLTWDNPRRLVDQAASSSGYSTGDQSASGQLANAPSNTAHVFKVEGGFALPMNSRFSFEGGYQQWKAFNPMLAYTVNTSIRPGGVAGANNPVPPFDASRRENLPDPNVDTNIESFSYLGKLAMRPAESIRVALTHDFYLHENKNKQYTMPGWGMFDQLWHQEQVQTPREGFSDAKTKLAVDYDINSWLSGDVGVMRTYKKQTREINRINEYEGSLGFTIRPSRDFFVNVSGLHQERRGNGMDFQHYVRTVSAATGRSYFSDAPGMRRPDVADRNRNQGRVQVQWNHGEVQASVSARMTQDIYRQGKGSTTGDDPVVHPGLMGLITDQTQAYGADVSVPLFGGVSADLFYEYDFSRRHLRSSQTACAGSTAGTSVGLGLPGEPACGAGTLAPTVMTQDPRTRWETLMRDHSHVAGIALNWLPLAKLKTLIGYEMVSTRQNLDPINAGEFASTAADPYVSFPTSRRFQQTARARAEYRFTDSLAMAANYQYDKFDATDFAYGEVPLRDLGNASIFLGANPIRNWYSHTVSLATNYRF